jgi:hypothetical protein
MAVAVALAALPAGAAANHSVLDLVSTGPAGGNLEKDANFRGASADGSVVFFETAESLVSEDTDGLQDVYARSGLTTMLVSTGPKGPNGAYGANFARASMDGTRVFFTTKDQLVDADTDNSIDVYQRSGTTTTLVSSGPDGGNGPNNALFDGASDDGTHVFFHTSEKLVTPDDNDSGADVYERSGSTTKLVTTGPAGGNAGIPAIFKGTSQDGTRVFFETYESLVSDDMDATADVYERSGGVTSRLSFGPAGGNGSIDEFFDASYAGSSADGTRVFFETNEELVSGDTDIQWDVYQRSGGTTTLVSTAPGSGNGGFDADYRGASTDGTKVFFQTGEPLVAGDGDSTYQDVYQRSGANTMLISTGPLDAGGAFDSSFAGASADGSHVFFSTPLALVSADGDGNWRDLYDRFAGGTNLVSTGPTDPNTGTNAFFGGASSDGSRAFFWTTDPLTSTDTDGGYQDVYERFNGATTLISNGPSGGNGPFGASFAGLSQDGLRVFFQTGESLGVADADSSLDVLVSYVNPLYPRPGGASPLRVSLVPAFSPCSSANAMHVAPLDYPSCSPPALQSSLLTTSTTGKGSAFARFVAIPGNTATVEDEADVRVAASASDVRNRSDGSDYIGKVILETQIRMTDKANAFSGNGSATVEDTHLGIPVDCIENPDTAIGGSCNVDTSIDTLVPNFVKEGKRTVIEAFGLNVLDAGPDGSVGPGCPPTCGSGDETVFLNQGVFVP